ncbi:MAG TPA: hypothetical protein VM468_05060 [Mycoplana sp.]|nr:hypothetical protein [Mycoplana sp.]
MKLTYVLLTLLAVLAGCQTVATSRADLDPRSYCFLRFGPSSDEYEYCVYSRQTGMEVTPATFGW